MNSAGWSYGPLNEDLDWLACHAQSTGATYFTGAVKSDVVPPIMVCWAFLLQSVGAEKIGHTRWPVKSDVVHLIMVCWAFLLRSFGAEQICHTRWPTEIFVHACVEVKPISILVCASTPATKHR